MSFQFNGVNAEVTISGDVSTDTSTIPTGATRIFKCMNHQVAGVGAYDIWTPTAGKIGYLTNLSICGGAGNTYKIGDNVTAALDSNTVYDEAVTGYVTVASQSQVYTFVKPMKITTKLNLYTANAGVTNFAVSFSGWEV